MIAIYICMILEQTFPVLGKMATQFSVDKYYTVQDYTLNFETLIMGCCVVFLCNLVLACWAFISEIRKNKGETK